MSMRIIKSPFLYAAILLLLALINFFWTVVNWYNSDPLRVTSRRFKFVHFRTNDVQGVGIEDTKINKPFWVQIERGGKPDYQAFYYQGRNVFNLRPTEGGLPKYDLYFYGPGKSATWWIDDKGSGTFTERIFYDTNGDFYKREVWYDQAWRKIDRRNGQNGIVIDGQWHQVALGTNTMWTVEPTSVPKN
jgi:hypothetical protein